MNSSFKVLNFACLQDYTFYKINLLCPLIVSEDNYHMNHSCNTC